jgi:hypothetical protein
VALARCTIVQETTLLVCLKTQPDIASSMAVYNELRVTLALISSLWRLSSEGEEKAEMGIV